MAQQRRKSRGRPPIPVETARRNRVVVMLTDGELKALHRLANEQDAPLGTVAHGFVARGLKRATRRD